MVEIKRYGKILVCLLVLPAAMGRAEASQLLERLRSDHAALVWAEDDYHNQRESGVLNRTEVADYAAYVARLHLQVAEDCAALAESAIPAPPDISCLTNPVLLIAPAAVDLAAERSSAEKTAELDAKLFSSMSEFDEMLLREQERIEAAAPNAADSAGSQGGDGSEGGTGSAGSEDSEGSEGSGEYAGEMETNNRAGNPTYGAGAGPGSTRRQGNSGTLPRTPQNSSDDDVVARQLREAAEKETDPELKKKLWEEYRRYKEGMN